MGEEKTLNEKMMDAAISGRTSEVGELLKKGANIDYFNDEKLSNKNTALCMAAMNGHKGVVELLISEGADLDHRNWAGNTAFSYAACNRNLDICDLLIEKGADPLIRSFRGGTTLMALPIFTSIPVEGTSFREVAEYLLNLGEDILAIDDEGRNALDFANREGNADFIELYEQWTMKASVEKEKLESHAAVETAFAEEKKSLTETVARTRKLPTSRFRLTASIKP